MDSLTSRLSGLAINGTTAPTGYVYLVGKSGADASFLHWSSDQLFCSRSSSIPDTFEPGQLYNLKRNSRGTAEFSDLREIINGIYINRLGYPIADSGYKYFVLQPLILGSRVRDFEQSCATVVHRSPLILTSPTRPGYLKKAQFRADTGELIDVIVEDVIREGEKSMKMICAPLKPLPLSIERKSRLQFCEEGARIPIVTMALESFYRGTRSIVNKGLLNRIYGERGAFVHSTVDKTLIAIRKKDGSDIILNAEQSEAVRRYLSEIPAFAVESPPGSGKTCTAAAMAASYHGSGLQLFLSTANVPVHNMAIALDEIDYGTKRIVHLVGADREAAQSEEERSPFSLFCTDDDENPHVDRFRELTEDLEEASSRQKRAIKRQMRKAHADALGKCGHLDVILATVDMILCKLLKKKNPKHPCPIQTQLETRVRRIVIDEASQLTEASLNAIILCFPHAQIVLIGDSKQLPPFKYIKGDVVSELAAASALEVLKQKRNVPVITLRQVYRAAPSMMKHYSECFYNGELVSGKPESSRVKLTSICKGITSKCMFIDVVRSKSAQSGTSKINDAEIGALKFVTDKLRNAGYDHTSVMVIAFYEAQRKLAAATLPLGYEVLTVDSAQGREKDIVIVLTTRDSPTTTAFFTCEKRCNVAVSRHKEAIIVLGHKALLKTEPWDRVLKKDYFMHVTYGQ